jgi:hypothetical protein
MDEALRGMQICTLLLFASIICFRKEFFEEEKKIEFVFVFAEQSRALSRPLSMSDSHQKRTIKIKIKNATSKQLDSAPRIYRLSSGPSNTLILAIPT